MKKNKKNVLIVDDEPNALKVLSAIIREVPYNVYKADGVETAKSIVSEKSIDAVITDFKMPGQNGLHLFNYLKSNYPSIPVIFLTAHGTVDSAVEAMTQGAFFYFIKPPDFIKLKAVLARAIEHKQLKDEIVNLTHQINSVNNSSNIIGKSPKMKDIYRMVASIKDSTINVLISGETGTGKEVLANAIHDSNKGRHGPLVAINCAAVPHELIESEFFGYEKGAFTGAISRRIGKFEKANKGTLFLDEVSELDLPLQAKILRAIQEKEIERLGGNKKIKIDIRLIASSNRDLNEEVKLGKFRADLFYRLNVMHFKLPPLRDRHGDIPMLVTHFLDHFSRREKKNIYCVSPEVIKQFLQYPWPGNIRELKNIIQRAVVITDGDVVYIRSIPDNIKNEAHINNKIYLNDIRPLKEIESETITRALTVFNGNKSKAAKALGVTRKLLYSRLKQASSYL